MFVTALAAEYKLTGDAALASKGSPLPWPSQLDIKASGSCPTEVRPVNAAKVPRHRASPPVCSKGLLALHAVQKGLLLAGCTAAQVQLKPGERRPASQV
jgi:hypothetical protein